MLYIAFYFSVFTDEWHCKALNLEHTHKHIWKHVFHASLPQTNKTLHNFYFYYCLFLFIFFFFLFYFFFSCVCVCIHVNVSAVPYVSFLMFISCAFASAVAQTTVNRIIHTLLFDINSLTHAYLYPYTYTYSEYHCQHFCFVHSHTCKPAHSTQCSYYKIAYMIISQEPERIMNIQRTTSKL